MFIVLQQESTKLYIFFTKEKEQFVDVTYDAYKWKNYGNKIPQPDSSPLVLKSFYRLSVGKKNQVIKFDFDEQISNQINF